MAQDNIIEWIGVVLLFLFGVTMICQGHFIFHQKHGYSRKETEDPEPEPEEAEPEGDA